MAAVAALVLLGAPVRAEELPKIFLEKRIFAETSEGKKSFYEVHTVSKGESLWKILRRNSPLFPANFADAVRAFRRANPAVRDPGRLIPGQKVLIPTGRSEKIRRMLEEGRLASYRIRRGDSLLRILAERGVPREDRGRYLSAVREWNESVRDVDRIFAGRTLLLPTAEYFAGPAAAPAARVASIAPAPETEEPTPEREGAAGEALTRGVPEQPGQESVPAAKPEAQLVAPPGSIPEGGSSISRPGAEPGTGAPAAATATRYRGLLADLAAGLGEKWIDRGTLYLPIPSGGEIVLDLGDYPVVRLSTGVDLLIDFRDALPDDVRALITATWKNYRVVGMATAPGPLDRVDRFLRAAGYHSVREGKAHPLVIGESPAVSIPADRIVLKTEQSLLRGEVYLIKEVPESPGEELAAVLRYADRVGIRVLPFAADPAAGEGFLVGIPEAEDGPDLPAESVPRGGLEAVDYALSFLGLPASSTEKISIGGKGGAFQLTVQPERIFTAGGKRHVVDTGKMSDPLKAIVRDSGYEIFSVGRKESGRSIFRRILDLSGAPHEDRDRFLLFGGETEGYEIRVTGTFLASAEYLEGKKIRAAVLVRGRVHSATRELMRRFGVEIVEW
ncbi:MAG: hypothetical protein Kow00128_14020 [Deltaproteobacteria bacterium]